MSIGGVFGRLAIQFVIGCIVAALMGGGDVFMLLLMLFTPGAFLAICVFAAIEHVASRFRARWLAFLIIPIAAAAWPWRHYLAAPNSAHFASEAWQMSWFFGFFGFSWCVASLLVLVFTQPAVPDERLIG